MNDHLLPLAAIDSLASHRKEMESGPIYICHRTKGGSGSKSAEIYFSVLYARSTPLSSASLSSNAVSQSRPAQSLTSVPKPLPWSNANPLASVDPSVVNVPLPAVIHHYKALPGHICSNDSDSFWEDYFNTTY